MTRSFRKGDIVTVEAEVVGEPFAGSDGRETVDVRISDLHRCYVETKHLLMKTPKIVVGDIVEWESSQATWRGEVLAVSEGHAWVSMGDGNYSTVWLPKIARFDPSPTIVDVAVSVLGDIAAAGVDAKLGEETA